MSNKLSLTFAGLVLALFCAEPQSALAQASSNGSSTDRFPQPLPEIEPLEEQQPLAPEDSFSPPVNEGPQVQVSRIEVIGSTVFEDEDFQPFIAPLEGTTVSFGELQTAANQITQLYQRQGYLTSQAVLQEQTITKGIVQIQILEGSLQDIQIEGNERLAESYVRSRLNLASSTPLDVSKLEDQLQLLRLDSLIETIAATLEAGNDPGASVLNVVVDETAPFFGSAGFDNYSPPSIGSEQGRVQLGYRNITGYGDIFSAAYRRSTTGGSNIWDLNYQLPPFNAMDGTLRLRSVIDRNEITEDPFDDFDIEGETELYEVIYRQPIIRSPRQEFALSAGFSFRDGQTFAFGGNPFPFGIGPDDNGVSRTSVIRFGQDYLSRDLKGSWVARSQFNFGTGLFDATNNSGDLPDGQFFSWTGQVQRLQKLSRAHLLVLQADLQLSPDSLLPSEQFALGGRQSIRGYRENARSGDNGVRFSVEDRITVARNKFGSPALQLIPFVEVGHVWNDSDNPNPLPDETTLVSGGLGAVWNPVEGLNLRLDYGIPFVDLDDAGDNLQDDGFHFSIGYSF